MVKLILQLPLRVVERYKGQKTYSHQRFDVLLNFSLLNFEQKSTYYLILLLSSISLAINYLFIFI